MNIFRALLSLVKRPKKQDTTCIETGLDAKNETKTKDNSSINKIENDEGFTPRANKTRLSNKNKESNFENHLMILSEDNLKQFDAFKAFNTEQFEFIKTHAKSVVVPKNKVLLKLDATHSNQFFLLNGEVQLVAHDGKSTNINHFSPSARNPIAQLRPSRYKVVSYSDVELLVMSEDMINKAIGLKVSVNQITDKYDEDNDVSDEIQTAYDTILFEILTMLHTDKLVLPSLPDIAFKIRKAAESEDSSAEDVISIINLDQSIMAKIIKTANSAAYSTSGVKVETLKNAYVRLGPKNVVNLVVSYTMKELFNADSELLKEYMKKLWVHSIKVAAISSILARLTPGFDPDKALLMGLLHNIGAVVVLNNLGHRIDSKACQENLENVLLSLQAEVGASLLSKWDFADELVEVVENSGDWLRNDKVGADYSDIINIAQFHAYIGTPYFEKLPPLDVIAGFHKLALGKLTPEMSLQVIEKSEEEIEETMAIFS